MIQILPYVSVIIPVYNTAPYLRRCLDSVCKQTLQNIEIICINDGSTDNSAEILQQYEEKDSRVCVITQENKGIAVARNIGLQYARGQYIGFVDSDDWIEPNMFALAYNTAQREHVDIVAWGYSLDLMTGQKAIKKEEQKGFHDTEQVVCAILSEGSYRDFLWNKLFSKNFILEKRLKFDETLAVMEDRYFVFEAALAGGTLFYVPEITYHYRRDIGSSYRLNDKSESMFTVSSRLVEELENTQYVIATKYAKAWYSYSVGALYLYYALQGCKEKMQFYNMKRKCYIKEYLQIHCKYPAKILRGLLIAYMPKVAIWLKQQSERKHNDTRIHS